MGSGRWDASVYASTTGAKIDSGTSFLYSDTTRMNHRDAWKVHEDLDPHTVAGVDSPLAGKIVRESRDNDEHPTSTPVAVFFDETGSMGNTPRVLQTKLTELFGLLLRKGYVEHPQVMMGAYGDGQVDRVPLQVSQFESDNRIDDALDKLFLESGGGGNYGESQNLAWYYLAHHTATDAWDKRGKRGYAFFIGDERCIDLTDQMVKKWVGDSQPLGEVDNASLVKSLTEKWDSYVFVIDNMSAEQQRSIEFYTELFGAKNVLVVQDEEAIAETIALTIGLSEGVIGLDEGLDDLKEIGASDAAISQAGKALAHYDDVKGNGNVVTTDTPEGLDDDADDVASV